jgi:hypothetical protein
MKTEIITCWDGDIYAVGVKDAAGGGVWWPNDDTQEAIQSAADPEDEARRICDSDPMRGTWVS